MRFNFSNEHVSAKGRSALFSTATTRFLHEREVGRSEVLERGRRGGQLRRSRDQCSRLRDEVTGRRGERRREAGGRRKSKKMLGRGRHAFSRNVDVLSESQTLIPSARLTSQQCSQDNHRHPAIPWACKLYDDLPKSSKLWHYPLRPPRSTCRNCYKERAERRPFSRKDRWRK